MRKKGKYVYAIMDGDYYDIDEIFDSAENAIFASITGQTVAVLDALSLEYLGCI